MEWWSVVIAIVGGFVIVWGVVVIALVVAARRSGDGLRLVEALRLVPDVVRLVRRLVADPTVPRGVRVALLALLGYLLLPIDLVPDFVPVIGYLDDAIVVALVLRFVTRRAGAAAVDRHWPGTPEGLRAVRAAVGLSGS
ncbi:YkvA family protein [Curtobacterium sp. YR515]|uniref:YkvA family protein n=1 Tax=Curtobacterium sp. YR515 TaxID=1855316 RepID=UPI0008F35FA3|nr:YkvA family protein [Curtobacterium sp. YR515]SFF87078.1 Uncharacterized membrane protein YkvA, DUF1232 family [Curtobacterium sp. YR515]